MLQKRYFTVIFSVIVSFAISTQKTESNASLLCQQALVFLPY